MCFKKGGIGCHLNLIKFSFIFYAALIIHLFWGVGVAKPIGCIIERVVGERRQLAGGGRVVLRGLTRPPKELKALVQHTDPLATRKSDLWFDNASIMR